MARTAGSSAIRTRQRVLEAARALFLERGYAGTSIRDIAEHLEMTKAALYYHFPAKEDLLRELVAPVAVELTACVRAAESRAEPRRDLLRRVVDLFDDNRHVLRGTLYDSSARQVLLAEDDLFGGLGALERALAVSGEAADLLLARCALGTIRGAIIPARDVDALALNRPPESGIGPGLSEQDRDLVTAAAWAALTAAGSTAS
ncbi:hypothetical protein GCM10027271_43610 [Saccharopolyspora gloriosae]|uniref:AcrR family transcriptional regulator n=1 Tax=Saccharopolyspora gloriosae TaxID=455344 RepID=A0A840NM32_9PSEU|nr:TetR/AcrR family transcriptional regulator [Saccharopolyspora gloriosae]MBB5070339.1 AcrR family transcriptional regulator [Saccharopolyspora gloriosae]